MKLDGRTLAAAFWASYFALHWLLILGIVEQRSATVFFLVVASLLSALVAAGDAPPKQKGSNGRKSL